MKRVLLLAVLLLAGCESRTPLEQEQAHAQQLHDDAKAIVTDSVIECSDDNQVRVSLPYWGTNAESAAVWPILDENGHPKRCVHRAIVTPQQFVEVPQ